MAIYGQLGEQMDVLENVGEKLSDDAITINVYLMEKDYALNNNFIKYE